jgi:hypothetical protein
LAGLMGAASRIPDAWPRRMSAAVAAAYMGVSESLFTTRVASKRYPAPINDGGRVLWDKRALDLLVDAQSGFDDASQIEPW